MVLPIKKIYRRSILALVIFALCIGSVPLTSSSASAAEPVSCDVSFYSSNDILFYDPCATSCGDTPEGTAGEVKSVRGKNNGEKIFNFWLDAGLTSQQAAGITGSMKHEGGFSPFRQEMSQTWPAGGWGIAQFTGGQRDKATEYVTSAIGSAAFEKYYVNSYGGAVVESNGFIPSGVPVDINDKFLLGELNYLLQYIRSFKPSSISARTSKISADFKQIVPDAVTLYAYIKTLVLAEDNAVAWTYLYEYPADIKATATVRSESAKEIMTLYSDGIKTTCGGDLQEGGMDLTQAKAFMEKYKSSADSINYIGGAARTCAGGPLSNCISFSVYFINKYTDIKGFGSGRTGNGSTLVANVIARNPDIGNGHSPRPYAIFSYSGGRTMCGNVKCGHTGIILGVTADKVIVGEAICDGGTGQDTAKEYPLSKFDSDAYTYAYTDGLLKAGIE